MEFIVRFWNELMNPRLDLKAILAMDTSSPQPVLITDAKALYDTYHRDALNHGSNDKRTALEVKVTRQQVESFGGNGPPRNANLAMDSQSCPPGNCWQVV